MIAWIKRLLWDETAFVRWSRGAIAAAAALYLTWQVNGHIDVQMVLSALGIGVAGLMGAGDKNPKQEGGGQP